jgi:RNA polymerase sigma-70 factor (ECF subfamily)
MIEPELSFRTLMDGIRNGSQEAAWRLIDLYGSHIQRVVRRTLDRRLRSQFDSLDFVQLVWASFFREPDRILSFETSNELVAYLAIIARNKVIDEGRRRLGTKKYDVTRERPIDDSRLEPDAIAATGPTPSEVAIARETWDRLIAGQSTQHQRVVELRFSGSTFPEIAEEVGIHERTARKVIERLLRFQVS